MKAVTAETMRSLDARTISEGVHTGMELMHAAAESAVNILVENMVSFFRFGSRIGILTGKGNNGGDGFVMASTYNHRLRPAEVLIGADGRARLIRRRETLDDLTATLVLE